MYLGIYQWAAENFLPTSCSLIQKRMEESHICPVRKAQEETVNHILLRCSVAQQVWCSCVLLVGGFQGISSKEWLSNMLFGYSSEEECLAFTVWAIWICRNKLVWKNRPMSAEDVISMCKTMETQPMIIMSKIRQASSCLINPLVPMNKWVKPLVGSSKVNCDEQIGRAHV